MSVTLGWILTCASWFFLGICVGGWVGGWIEARRWRRRFSAPATEEPPAAPQAQTILRSLPGSRND